MKDSHMTTPRTLADCHFATNADPIERFETPKYDWQDRVVMWGCAAAAVAVSVILWTS